MAKIVANTDTGGRARLRKARADDLGRIAELEKRIFKVEGAWGLEEYEADYAKKNRIYIVAELDGEVAAYAFAEWRGEAGFIRALAVRSESRGSGLGAAMLDKLCAALWRQGMARVVLHVRENNARAIGLYQTRGFKRRRRLKNYYDSGVHAIEMVRSR